MSSALYSIQVWLPEGMQVAQVSAVRPEDKGYPYYLKIESCYPVVNEEKSQMTREEAIAIVNNQVWNSPVGLVSTLEALGLLKVEEPKQLAASTVMMRSINKHVSQIDISRTLDIIKDLQKAGYEIVRKDNE